MSVITAQPAKAVSQSKIVIAAIIGNLLEFYDFTVYSFFALTIAKLFFPAHDPVVSTLLALSAFAIGFVARPVGGFVLGHYADKRGRRAALTLTIFLMAIGSAMIGLAPSYASIGLAAPALIIFARLLQGFAQGGEFGAATATLLETGSAKGRGFRASWQLASQGAAALMGSGIAALLTYQLSSEQLLDWGWRVPFLIGTLIMPVGVYLRRHIVEEPPKQAKAAGSSLEPGRAQVVPDCIRHHGHDGGDLRPHVLHPDLFDPVPEDAAQAFHAGVDLRGDRFADAVSCVGYAIRQDATSQAVDRGGPHCADRVALSRVLVDEPVSFVAGHGWIDRAADVVLHDGFGAGLCAYAGELPEACARGLSCERVCSGSVCVWWLGAVGCRVAYQGDW